MKEAPFIDDEIVSPSIAHRKESVTRTNFKDQVFVLIRDEIMAGILKPGIIYSMGDFATRYGASRTPVREALIELESKGIIKFFRGVGFGVIAPSSEYLRDTLQLREILETQAMVSIAGQLTTAEYQVAHDLMMEVHEIAISNDAIRYRKMDYNFHVYLASLTGNDRLVSLVQELRDTQMMPGLNQIASAGNLVERSSQHFKILDAIKVGDAKNVAVYMSSHISFSRESFSAPEKSNRIETMGTYTSRDSRVERGSRD
jgi:DNA-binding GntR family transcriptional regulator